MSFQSSIGILDQHVALVQSSELERSEEHIPNAVVDFLEPDVFAGPNDHWHQHIGLCLKDNVVIGAETMSAATCTSLGGTKAEAANGWMIHAWVVPGWESPEGVFSPEHPGLV